MGLKIERQEKIGAMDHEMTGIVLAGGKATRMGGACDKAFLKIGSETIIDRQLKALRFFFKEIIIVTNSPDRCKPPHQLRGKHAITTIGAGVKIISDVIRDRGPMGGIYSGLLASGSFYNFVVACDMPFINRPLVRYIIENKSGYDIVIPKIGRRFHPLLGAYSKNCILPIEKMLKYNRLKVANIFSKVKTRFLSRQEIGRFDKDMASLVNINTPEELKRVESVIKDAR